MPFDASERRQGLMFAADGALICAGTFGLMIGTAFVLDWLGVVPLGEPHGSGLVLVLSIVSWLLQVGGSLVGPVLVWWLYRRRFDKVSILALLIGLPISGAVVMALAMLGALIDWIVGLFTKAQFVGAIGYLVIVVLAALAIFTWLVINAVRDLSSASRTHVRLDAARLAAVATVVIFAAVVVVKSIGGEDALEAGVFLLAAGVGGASVVTAADLIIRALAVRAQKSAPAES